MSSEVFKNSPTIFPHGFSISKTCNGEITLIEFSDTVNGIQTCIGSYALPKSALKTLSESILESLEENME